MDHSRKAFTLVELLVVVAILALLLAILLPSLQRAKYQAKVVTCMTRLRGIATGMILYTNENAGELPEGKGVETWTGGSWFGSPRELAWLMAPWNSSKGNYDLRDVYREYLGPLNKSFKCPLATESFADRDMDSSKLANYMLYPTNNWRTKHFDYGDEPGGFTKLTMGFSVTKSPQIKFGLLASDQAMGRYGNVGPLSGHPAFNGSYGEIGNGRNDTLGYSLGMDFTAPINYANHDGSVHTFDIDGMSYLNLDGKWVINRGAGSGNKYMLLPRELGW